MFKKRSEDLEVMDDLSCSGEELVQTLKELEIINKYLGGTSLVISSLNILNKKFQLQKKKESIVIADFGCGGGDILKEISIWSRRNKISVQLIGIDANPNVIEYARLNCKSFQEIRFICSDIDNIEFKKNTFDIIICTLFCHHFDDIKLKGLIKDWNEQCKIGLVINDLHRHWLAYYSINYLTKLFSKSPMVKNDAKLSVLKAFKRKEIEALIKDSGFRRFQIEWRWAFRYLVLLHK